MRCFTVLLHCICLRDGCGTQWAREVACDQGSELCDSKWPCPNGKVLFLSGLNPGRKPEVCPVELCTAQGYPGMHASQGAEALPPCSPSILGYQERCKLSLPLLAHRVSWELAG